MNVSAAAKQPTAPAVLMTAAPEPGTVGAMPVSAFVGDEVVGVDAGATLFEAADLLVAEDIGVLAVRENGRVMGVVSERDLIHALTQRRPPDTTRAIDVASTILAFCDCEATVAEVAIEMAERYVRHVLVEDDGRVVGIVSARDLLGAYAAAEVEFDWIEDLRPWNDHGFRGSLSRWRTAGTDRDTEARRWPSHGAVRDGR